MLSKESPYREQLMNILFHIENQLKMEENDQVLMVILLNTEEKVIRFVEWLKTKVTGEMINATISEIMYEVSMIGRTDL